MTLKKIKKGLIDDTNKRGGYLILYFPKCGLVTVRVELVVCAKKCDYRGPLLNKAGKPTAEAKYVKPSLSQIQDGPIVYRHNIRQCGLYREGDAGVVDEVFEGLFAFVPHLDLTIESRVLAACKQQEALKPRGY